MLVSGTLHALFVLGCTYAAKEIGKKIDDLRSKR